MGALLEMTMKRCLLLMAAVFALAACALGDTPAPTSIPPVTLRPPNTPIFSGDCEGTAELNAWLESADFLVGEYLNTINSMSNLTPEAMREKVIYLGRVRDEAVKTVTPECAQQIHTLMLDSMNNAVDHFQAYANGDADNLGAIIAEVIGQIDRIIAAQDELKNCLEAQFQSQGSQ